MKMKELTIRVLVEDNVNAYVFEEYIGDLLGVISAEIEDIKESDV